MTSIPMRRIAYGVGLLIFTVIVAVALFGPDTVAGWLEWGAQRGVERIGTGG